MKKTTIYIDVDDDITAIIDKVAASKENLAVLVLPKRAAVLQSVVNMKLLKKAADTSKKKLVLVTVESTLMPLAAAAGVYVAKSLTSKPEIPELKIEKEPEVEEIDPEVSEEDPKIDPSKPIGELAGPEEAEETIDVPEAEGSTEAKAEKSSGTGVKKLAKKLKVPNFDSFRNRLLLAGVGLVGLIIFWIFGFMILPKAKIVITTETTSVAADFTFNASVKTKSRDLEKALLPAEVKEVKKTEVEKFTATGEKDMGTKATGAMNLTSCIDQDTTVPAGTSFSNGSFKFVTTEAVTLKAAIKVSGVCRTDLYTALNYDKDVDVQASGAGDSYNLSARSYTSSISGINAYGSAMSGGTSKIVKVISDSDVSSAKDKLLAKVSAQMKDDLKKQLEASGNFAIVDSFLANQSEVLVTPKVGEEATEGQASIEFNYSMYGVKERDIEDLIAEKIKNSYDSTKQSIVDSALTTASIKVSSRPATGEVDVAFKGNVLAGPILDSAAIAKEIVGQRLGATEKIIRSRPGIKDVKITYSPFWIFSTPKSTDKITISFENSVTQNDQTTQP